MSDYNLTALKNISKLYGWEEDKNGYIKSVAVWQFSILQEILNFTGPVSILEKHQWTMTETEKYPSENIFSFVYKAFISILKLNLILCSDRNVRKSK